MKIIILLIFIFFSQISAKEKHLILAEGNGWFPHMAKNFIDNHEYISKLPFSGFVMVGNHYTDLVMEKGRTLTYKYIWDEVKGVKDLYPNKENFLQINIHFPADFWDNEAWKQVSKNFTLVAQVAKDLGFKGIVFDDEPYSKTAQKMVNFRFPTKQEISNHPQKYSSWEKEGAQLNWVDRESYRNNNHSFKEHTTQLSSHFKDIMSSMLKVYPELTMLIYLGPSLSHLNSNKNYPIVIDMGLPRQHEFHGAIFTGLKQGLGTKASLHDMGESYKYRKNKHFGYAYQWRKYDIADDKYNNLDENYYWVVPKSERLSWSNEVKVGFMVFNKAQKSTYPEYNTLHTSSVAEIGETLKKALNYSDKYVIYYCEKQDWLLPNKKYPLPNAWMKMMKEVYRGKLNQ